MPPTMSSPSRTIGLTPVLASRYAAVSPAGPAPTMTTRSPGSSGATVRGAAVAVSDVLI
jgi:hypothetical protein